MHSNQGLGAALAVVVVYQRPWREVHASRLLEAVLERSRDVEQRSLPTLGRLLVYDNTPVPTGQPGTLPNCEYVHDASNGGTRAAYLRALRIARERGLSWLILLDHDTTLSFDYLDELDRRLVEVADPSLGLLFPRIVDGEGLVSPASINRWGTVMPVEAGQHGTAAGAKDVLTAIASGAAIRVEALAAVGEIPPALWLDYLDHWLFREVQRRGYRAECLKVTLEHDLSIRSAKLPGAVRQRNILRAERYFTGTLGLSARLAYPFRLLRRALKVFPRDAGAAVVILRQLLHGWPGR